MTRAEVLDVLANGDFDPLVGLDETIDVEFKGAPYQVADRDSQKFELAKDVSALANASGGVIVIGVQTDRDNEAAVDVATELRPLARGLVDEQQYEGILSDMIYPRLRDVQVRFHPYAADADRGLVSIDVPPQDELEKYFLIQRPAEEGVDRTPAWLVGLAVRGVGRVEGRRIGEIHTLINRGLAVGTQLGGVLESVAELRDLIAGNAEPPAETPADRIHAVLCARLDELDADV